MSDDKDRDIIPILVKAFSDFSKSSDKLSATYGQLIAKVPEEELHEGHSISQKHSLLLRALEYISDGLIVVDHESRAVLFNTAAQELTGSSVDEILDEFYLDVLRKTMRSATNGHFRKRSSSGAELDMYTAPVFDDSQKIMGAVGIITTSGKGSGQRKRMPGRTVERYLEPKTSKSDLAPVLSAIGDIIVNIAHRMRSPLSAIQLFAEMLKQDLEEDKQEIIDDILVGVHSLDAVLSNLLSFAQPVKPDFRKVDIAAILDESLFFAVPAIKQQGISLTKKYSHDKLYCQGDLEQLKQVFFNLILNAIQAMPDGGILSIRISHIDEEDYLDFVTLGFCVCSYAFDALSVVLIVLLCVSVE